MIDLQNVSVSYEKGRPVLQGVTFHVSKGESVGLIGANGAGKSTLMKALLGLLPAEGEIRVEGTAVTRASLPGIRKKLGYVLQDPDNQMFMPTVLEDMVFGPVNYGLSREAAEEKALSVLEKLGLQALASRHNHKLSGGEKRMAAIAAVLAMEPEVLLMDEPSANLDPCNRRTVIRTICALPQTKLIASHDLDMILDCCGRVILLSGGRIAADGPAEAILRDRGLLEANRMELPLSLSGKH